MAAKVSLTPSHLSRFFKQTIAQISYQLLMAYRIEKAKKMLDNPNTLMANIAFACGFSES